MNDEQRIAELNRWAGSLDGPELEYLLEEAQREFSRVEQQVSALDARLIAVVGWALLGIGTLLIAGIDDFDLSARGIVAAMVIVGASSVLIAGSYALLPRQRAVGMDVSGFTNWQPTGARYLKAYVLAGVLFGTTLSREARGKHILALQLAVLGLIIEFGALAAHLILSAG